MTKVDVGERIPSQVLEDVRWGLAQSQKQLPSKYFYDTRGSELFEEITELPEYYLTRAETGLLRHAVAGWVKNLPTGTVELLVEAEAAEMAGFLDEIARHFEGQISSTDDLPPGDEPLSGFSIRY